MNSEADGKGEIQRLHDIVVEEVSLVDHAANKHRFLIVKRRSDMDSNEDTNDTTDDPITDLNEEDDETEDDSTEGKADTDENASTLDLAVQALEGLTETVELLGTASDDDARSRLSELATELRGVSEQLTSLAGASNDNQDAPRPAPAPQDSKPDKPENKLTAQPTATIADTLNEQLQTLTDALRTLTKTVKDQQKRVTRLEKRSGMPNSKSPGEQPKRPVTDDNASWPLDMNSSFERDNVDKSVSFHDV